MDPDTFGRRLKASRALAGHSQESLGEKLGQLGFARAARSTVSDWEMGKGKPPPPRVVDALAEICGVQTEFLADEDFDPLARLD